MARIVTLLSDFGLRDSYVAEMKASILSVCPHAVLVDISHSIEKFDVRRAAFVLASAARSFPKGTIHLAVVDPGVGSERRPIIVKSKCAHYVGPDNGILILAAGITGLSSVFEIETKNLPRKASSATFHGRDIFGPVAGLLASGVNASRLGRRIYDYVDVTLPRLKCMGDHLYSEIIHIDDFGNVVIGVCQEDLKKVGVCESFVLQIGRQKARSFRFVKNYSDLKRGSFGCLISSHGFLEVAKNMGCAGKSLHVNVGDLVSIVGSR